MSRKNVLKFEQRLRKRTFVNFFQISNFQNNFKIKFLKKLDFSDKFYQIFNFIVKHFSFWPYLSTTLLKSFLLSQHDGEWTRNKRSVSALARIRELFSSLTFLKIKFFNNFIGFSLYNYKLEITIIDCAFMHFLQIS